MPGFDGTGPRGMGPMTGGGRGLCVLKLSAEPDEPIIGLAGRAGRPVRRSPECEAELTQFRQAFAKAILCADADVPYFALWVGSAELLVKP